MFSLSFFTILKERLEQSYPTDLKKEIYDKVNELEELQKAKSKSGKVNEKILKPIIKAENDLWQTIGEYQKTFSLSLLINEQTLHQRYFDGFDSPWEYIGIERKLFLYLNNNSHLFYERDKKFPCTKCWSDPEEVTTYTLNVYDEKINKPRMDWQRGVTKQRKYFKKGIHLYVCKTCGKWKISSKVYNPHG